MKVFLHTCCAPCLVKCHESLKDEGITPTLFWYNPNIHPWTEYKSRKECLLDYAKKNNLNVVVEENYGLRFVISKFYPNFGSERCKKCYEIRLEKTVQEALLKGYKYFSTTLLISPYQNHEMICEICFSLAKKYGVEFLYRDFRKYFREGQKKARETGLYMQKYCGCIFSEEERYIKQIEKAKKDSINK